MNSKKIADKKYHKKLKSLIVKFNLENDLERIVFDRLENVESKKGYIMRLIKEDIKK